MTLPCVNFIRFTTGDLAPTVLDADPLPVPTARDTAPLPVGNLKGWISLQY